MRSTRRGPSSAERVWRGWLRPLGLGLALVAATTVAVWSFPAVPDCIAPAPALPLPGSCQQNSNPPLPFTKTIYDENGGTLDPGDLLTYTITIRNTNLNVDLVGDFWDPIGANQNAAGDMPKPADFTCASPTGTCQPGACAQHWCQTGGGAGTANRGYLYVPNLVVPRASGGNPGTVTITYEVRVDSPASGQVCDLAEYAFKTGAGCFPGAQCLASVDPDYVSRKLGTCRVLGFAANETTPLVTKTSDVPLDPPVVDGQRINYTIRVCSDALANQPTASLTLVDDIPTHESWDGNRCISTSGTPPPAPTDGTVCNNPPQNPCTSGPGGCNDGANLKGQINLSGFVLQPGDCLTVTFATTVDAGIPAGSPPWCNQAQVSYLDRLGRTRTVLSDDPDNPASNQDAVCHKAAGGGGTLSEALKTAVDITNPGAFAAGDTVEYTVTIANRGNGSFSGYLTDTIPGDLLFDPASDIVAVGGGGADCNNNPQPPSTPGQLNLCGITVPNGPVPTVIIFRAKLNACPPLIDGTVVSNQATFHVTSPLTQTIDTDGNPAAAGQQPTNFVGRCQAQAALSVRKCVCDASKVCLSSGPVLMPGDTLNYCVTVTNSGSVDTTGQTISDTVDDPNLTNVGTPDCGGTPGAPPQAATGAAYTCKRNEPAPPITDTIETVTCSNVSIAAGASFVMSFSAQVALAFKPVNPASAGGQAVCNQVTLGSQTAATETPIALASPDLLRDDQVTTLSPKTPALATIFAGPVGCAGVDPTLTLLETKPAPDCSQALGEGVQPPIPGNDGENYYVKGWTSDASDPGPDPNQESPTGTGLLSDASRPLMFYQLARLANINSLKLIKDALNKGVKIAYQ